MFGKSSNSKSKGKSPSSSNSVPPPPPPRSNVPIFDLDDDRDLEEDHGFTGSSGGEVQGEVSALNPTNLWKYDQISYRKLLAKMICVQHFPFSHLDNFMFNQMVQLGLQPSAKKVSRSTCTRDVAKIVGEYKYVMINTFSDLKVKVSICADIWSDSFQKYSYLGVTCHWIDDSWTLNKRLIAYKDFDEEHSAANIRDKLHDILDTYTLTNKIFSIGFDNVSANTASIEDLKNICQPSLDGRFFHNRCMCHILNLCVQDGLLALNEQIAPIKDAIVYMTRRGSLMKKWKAFCRANGLHPKKFSLDVTRWNSTYKLLRESMKYKLPLCQFFAQENFGYHLYPQYWEPCIKICEMLEIFNDATLEMSKIYEPTCHVALDYCVKIVCVLRENFHDPVLYASVACMMEKWMKHFATIPKLYLIAKVFDPRYKLEGLEGLMTFYYNALYPRDCLTEFDPYSDVHPNSSEIVASVKQILLDLFREYMGTQVNLDLKVCQFSSSSSSSRSTSTHTHSGPLLRDLCNFMDARTKKRSRSSNANPYQEIETYLTIPFEYAHDEQGDPLDILKWWSRRINTYPVLSMLAREILSSPASTVACEQAFSVGSYTLDATRSNMTVENVENQCLLDDWVRAEHKAQLAIKENRDSEEWTSSGGSED